MATYSHSKLNIKEMKKMKENVKDILVASFYKETQVGRSIGSSNKQGKRINPKKFKRELLSSIIKLRKLVDSKTIKNSNIRKEIKELSKKTGVSIGQSQKVINVYLKFYCLILDSPLKVIKELDCPLDSITMENKQKMKNLTNIKDYIKWQNKFKQNFGIRLLRDKAYDSNRINLSFKD